MNNKFCKRLKDLRIEKDLTQKNIANFLGLTSYTTISKWEKGVNDPPIELCVKLSELLGVSLNYLVGESEKRQDEPKKAEVIIFTQVDISLVQRFRAMSSIGQKMVMDMISSIEKMEKRK